VEAFTKAAVNSTVQDVGRSATAVHILNHRDMVVENYLSAGDLSLQSMVDGYNTMCQAGIEYGGQSRESIYRDRERDYRDRDPTTFSGNLTVDEDSIVLGTTIRTR
jgi:hypothetical protein